MDERKRKRAESPAADSALKGERLRDALAQLAETRAGGAYIPPARLRALMAEAQAADPGSVEYQRMSWDALRKSITGLVNKVAADNIKHIVPELFSGANLIRGRGLFCRSVMHAQEFSLPFTPVFAALVAIVNTKLPFVGELLVKRLVSQFRRAYRRNDKPKCHAVLLFIAHLVNQRVAHELLALELLVLLLEVPTDDSVELSVAFMREVGAFLAEEAPKATNSIFDRFRAVLYEGAISVRVQYMIEVLAQTRKDKFKENPAIPEQLDLVEEEDQITHQVGLDGKLDLEEGLNIFKEDHAFVENEEKYAQIKAEILGEDGDEEEEEEGGEETEEEEGVEIQDAAEQLDIEDRTETNLVNLRRTIYLVIMSSLDFEEAVHKLLKLHVREGLEMEVCNMVVECCSQERTYAKFYGHIGERLSKLDRLWSGLFEQCFRTFYDTIHRYETNRLRNIARFFGHLLASDSISWASFEIVRMTEDDTTSSSRIFIKILFSELQTIIGLKALIARFKEPSMQADFSNMFPLDHPRNTRFSINYFTSIGLGAVTDGMREHLKNAPRMIMEQREAEIAARRAAYSDESSMSDSGSYSSYSSGTPASNRYQRIPRDEPAAPSSATPDPTSGPRRRLPQGASLNFDEEDEEDTYKEVPFLPPQKRAAPLRSGQKTECGHRVDKQLGALCWDCNAKVPKPTSGKPKSRSRAPGKSVIGEQMNNIERLGELSESSVDAVSKVISKNRRLTDVTMQFFLARSAKHRTLYDCSAISSEAFLTIPTFAPNLVQLSLQFCGQFDNEALAALGRLEHLKELELYGAFLVRAEAWIAFFRAHGHRLTTLKIRETPRIDTAVIQALVASCTRLEHLALAQIGHLDEDGARLVQNLGHLSSLELSQPGIWAPGMPRPSLTSGAILPTLQQRGAAFTSVNLARNAKLDASILDDGLVHCPSLTFLCMDDNTGIPEEAWERYFNSDAVRNLEHVSVDRCAAWPHWHALHRH
ncbi:Cwc22p [Malassezia vespertilionis]|uniref:Cwc22p n=1 Tax=Malassezia vespertilionis TaxID=2020962 RepID=A0A2N1J805_9BASI|nr:Cwc22p [Malassezia vespertilionis]